MRPRWRSRGDGLDGMHPKDRSMSEGRRQPSLLAREEWPLAVRGRRSAEPLQARAGPVPDQPQREALWGAFAPSAENDVVGRRRLICMISRRPGHHPSRRPGRHLPDGETSCARHGITAMPSAISDEADQTVSVGNSALGRTRSEYAGISKSESNDAISASGALNRPRLSSGGTTASTASNFSDGSMRR